MTSRIAVVGATGTLGTFIVDLIGRTPDLELHAGLSSRDDLDRIVGADLVVDVTHPAVSPGIVEHAVRAGIPVLVGTSGWSSERIAKLSTVVADVAGPGVLVVPNFSSAPSSRRASPRWRPASTNPSRSWRRTTRARSTPRRARRSAPRS
nr:hypothetical protein GCM10025699_57380 [Microbacterium flavescens]